MTDLKHFSEKNMFVVGIHVNKLVRHLSIHLISFWYTVIYFVVIATLEKTPRATTAFDLNLNTTSGVHTNIRHYNGSLQSYNELDSRQNDDMQFKPKITFQTGSGLRYVSTVTLEVYILGSDPKTKCRTYKIQN